MITRIDPDFTTMEKFLTNNQFLLQQTVALLALFLSRMLLVSHEFYQGFSFLLLLMMAVLYLKIRMGVVHKLLTEIGGSGHYFELAGLPLNSSLSPFFSGWPTILVKTLPQRLKIQTDLNYVLLVFFLL